MANPQLDTAHAAPAPRMDAESLGWVRDLQSAGPPREGALGRLHAFLLKVARAEAARRRGRLPDHVLGELDDLCTQAASDAVLAVLRKLDSFRGAARFTTWAAKFVILEFSGTVRRRAWRQRAVGDHDERIWERLPDGGPDALQGLEHQELAAALRRAVERDLTARQRTVFTATLLEEVPIDVLAERLETTRGAVYKMLHDARRKLRASLTRAGYLEPPEA